MPKGTVETLLKPESKAFLIKLLTYHFVAGNLKSSDVLAAIKVGKEKAFIKTIQGENVTARLVKGRVILTNASGVKATATDSDLTASKRNPRY